MLNKMFLLLIQQIQQTQPVFYHMTIEYYFNGAAKVIKKDYGNCEDAFFLLGNAAGVSDGVGGWADYGLSSSAFSNSLMKHCCRLIVHLAEVYIGNSKGSSIQDSILFGSSDLSSCKEIEDRFLMTRVIRDLIIDPYVILGQAYERVSDIGSATALVCALNGRELTCANIGDSQFLLIRFDNNNNPFVLLKSTQQQHVFNTPYQLAKVPTPAQIEYELQQQLFPPDKINEIVKEDRKSVV